MLPWYIDSQSCTGCGACENICTNKCIKMKEAGDLRFFYPDIDEKECSHCGLCEKACPVTSGKEKKDFSMKCYAAWADNAIRYQSSSGGAFTLIAEYILENEGIVCGAELDENLKVYHTYIVQKDQLHRYQKSKYVQSKMGDIYHKIEEALKSGKSALFSGCPCQVAGVRRYLDIKNVNTKNLILVNIFCFGVPSQYALDCYIKESFGDDNVQYLDFRNKRYGWNCQGIIIKREGCEKYFDKKHCEYEMGFHNSIIMRDSCYDCKFCEAPFEGDISLADFWGIERFRPDWNDNRGTSLLTVNTEKGEKLLRQCMNRFKRIEEMPTEYIANRTEAKKDVPLQRKRFLELIKDHSFCEAIEQVTENKFDIGVVGLWYFTNRGTEMTYFALYHVLKDMGYSVLLISQPENSLWKPTLEPIFYDGVPYKEYEFAKFYPNKEAMIELNNHCKMFILGSDQWLKNEIYKIIGEFSSLDWVLNTKYKMVYSTSFGHEYWEGSETERDLLGHYLKEMDAFSVREESGVALAKNTFGISAKLVLDPVFLCDYRHFEKMAEKGKQRLAFKKYLCAYILDPDENKLKLIHAIADKLNLDAESFFDGHITENSLSCQWDITSFYNVTNEEWMAHYKNAEFIITDSFHGMCFAIIHQKPFVALVNEGRGAERFLSLAKLLGVENRLLYFPYDLENQFLEDTLDYAAINQQLSVLRSDSLEWLKSCISDGLSKEQELNAESALRYENYRRISKMYELEQELKADTTHIENMITWLHNVDIRLGNDEHAIRKNRPMYRKVLSKIKAKMRPDG